MKNSKIISEGPGDIQASGSSNELNFHASGSGDVSLRQLNTKKSDFRDAWSWRYRIR